MRKITVAILAFLYINIAGGVVVNIHYCMGEFSSIQWGYSDDDGCDKCGMKNKKGCCHTEHKFVKLQDEHQLAKASVDINQPVCEGPVREIGFAELVQAQTKCLSFNNHSPPDQTIRHIYLHNCVFRI